MSHALSLRAHVRDLPAFRVFLMLWGGLLLLDLVRSTGPALSVAALALAAALLSLRASRTTALLVAGVAWLLANGFVVHDYGTLAWTGLGDVVRLVALAFAALAGSELVR